jgi:phytoene dehydrogenase-like protein
MEKACDVVVVGGGLCGLTAAAYLGRAGQKAVVVEKAKELGGRARTTEEKGFFLNLGAHAIYRNGHAWRALEELGVPLAGGIPKASGALALADSGVHALPTGLFSLLTTGLLSLGAKMELSRVLATLGSVDAEALMSVPASEWIERSATSPAARHYLEAFFRVSTYTGDLGRLSAGAAIAQLQTVQKHNVLYLDGGWQTLVDALRERATAAGAAILTGDGAAKVEPGRGEVRVTLHDGGELRARAVVLATGPHAAAALVPSAPALARLAEAAVPAKVATLDVALSHLPRPRNCLGLGTDRPTYVSVHSAVARLAPEGGAMVHAMLYQPSGDARADERELEEALDRVQPGWREHVAYRRFLPAMVATNDILAAAKGGFAGRPDVAVEGAPGVYIAGDWVGRAGMLLDAAVASARRAADACAALAQRPKPRSAADAAAARPALA